MDFFNDLAGKVASQGQFSLLDFFWCMAGAGALSGILTISYIRFGRSLSNRKIFAANFIPITLTTMFIISVVKSSLALSLGLVGALSIVRFRTAIREPEELVYLFICIALGLGFGAAQWQLSLIAFAIILAVILAVSIRIRRVNAGNGILLILQKSADSQEGRLNIDLSAIQSALTGLSQRISITRIDSGTRFFEASLVLEGVPPQRLPEVLQLCHRSDPALRCLLVDSSGKTID